LLRCPCLETGFLTGQILDFKTYEMYMGIVYVNPKKKPEKITLDQLLQKHEGNSTAGSTDACPTPTQTTSSSLFLPPKAKVVLEPENLLEI